MKRFIFFFVSMWIVSMGASAQEDKCDVNGDGVVNIMDVMYVVDHVLGNHEPKAVDLGLPSGTKWADRNVGANKPEEYGGYYAWGETEEKDVYEESTYKYYQNGDYMNIGIDISGTQYDVAHVKWGSNWRMPTIEQCKELLDNCTIEHGEPGYPRCLKFISKINGNSIYLPCAGYRWFDWIEDTCWNYWLSTQDPSSLGSANFLEAAWFGGRIRTCGRHFGQSVRPVYKE